MVRWFLLCAVGCAPKPPVPEEEIQPMPPWMTKEGGLQVRIEVAKNLVDSGNTAGALDVIRKMRADGIDVPDLDLLQGKALRLDGVTDEAERLLLQAQKRMPHDSRPATELCILYADDKQLDKAIDRCKKATSLDPHDGKAWNNLGFLELANSMPQDALEAAEKAVEIDSTEPRYRNNLGMAQAAIGREEQAFHTFQSTMNRADAAYMVGQVVERFKGADAAAPWYQKALDYDPRHELAQAAIDDGGLDNGSPVSATVSPPGASEPPTPPQPAPAEVP